MGLRCAFLTEEEEEAVSLPERPRTKPENQEEEEEEEVEEAEEGAAAEGFIDPDLR